MAVLAAAVSSLLPRIPLFDKRNVGYACVDNWKIDAPRSRHLAVFIRVMVIDNGKTMDFSLSLALRGTRADRGNILIPRCPREDIRARDEIIARFNEN